jgi:hypothetical protein
MYHLFEYLWPELKVNYEYWPNGMHAGWNQVLLTPGIIFGRFKIGQDSPTRPINLIIGAGYHVAVTPNPVVQNNVVATFGSPSDVRLLPVLKSVNPRGACRCGREAAHARFRGTSG